MTTNRLANLPPTVRRRVGALASPFISRSTARLSHDETRRVSPHLTTDHAEILAPRLRTLLSEILDPDGDAKHLGESALLLASLDRSPQAVWPLVSAVAATLPLDPAHVWLLLAVLTARLPRREEVVDLRRRAQLDGLEAALVGLVATAVEPGEETPSVVRVVRDAVLLDVHNTALAEYATGVQRVTREVSRRWLKDHELLLVGWTSDLGALRALSDAEVQRTINGGPLVDAPATVEVVVPWSCSYLVPELATEPARTERLRSLGELSGTRLGLIGYDLIPVTTAETCLELSGGFLTGLAAARQAHVLAPISEAAAREFRGWTRMLSGTGLSGPHIEAVVLPTEVPAAVPGQVEQAQARLVVDSLPLVLVVGSHEPRKNHLSVLFAAETLWREGLRFSLTLIGGNAWHSEEFQTRVEELTQAGRPIETITAGSDDLLWGAYRSARFTVFPSLNEGFGLPLAESLSCGTPAITSGFGSLREIADMGGGALFVDPRDDYSVADGMRVLLTDDVLLERLRAEAVARPVQTWDDYAARLWDVLTRERQ